MSRSEDEIVRRIREIFGAGEALVGIGDDAAVLAGRGPTVVTTDLLIEHVDFTRAIPLRWVAAKSLAVNVSDLAAMGARGFAFVLSIGCPPDLVAELETFLEAMAEAASRWKMSLVGGDLSSSRDLTVSIAAFGELGGAQPLLRTGARVGDGVFVSRPLGGSAAGLALLRRGWRIDAGGVAHPPADLPATPGYAQMEFALSALRRHVSPEPEADLGPALARQRLATACIDVSDGLSTDLHRLCAASGCGALIDASRIPRFPDVETAGFSLGVDARSAVLHGGEELALLFTSPLRESELSSHLGRPVYRIGRMTAERDVTLDVDGLTTALPAEGFDHFKVESAD